MSLKRTPLGPGKKALERGSSFETERKTLSRRNGVARLSRGSVSPASPAQRKKARLEPCVVSGQEAVEGATIDPAHIASKSGMYLGCDDPLCVVPLRRDLHRAFDDGELDLQPYLTRVRVPELCHALEHYEGDLIALLERVTNRKWREA